MFEVKMCLALIESRSTHHKLYTSGAMELILATMSANTGVIHAGKIEQFRMRPFARFEYFTGLLVSALAHLATAL